MGNCQSIQRDFLHIVHKMDHKHEQRLVRICDPFYVLCVTNHAVLIDSSPQRFVFEINSMYYV